MVRAILEDRKEVTRRVVKPQPELLTVSNDVPFGKTGHRSSIEWAWRGEQLGQLGKEGFLARCPYGRPGDRLWVRETHRPAVAHSCAMDACDCGDVNVEYRADGEIRYFSDYTISDASPDWCLPKAAQRNKFVPAIHMPRWASRITLEVTGVRVERLHDISETQAEAEGIHRVSIGSGYPDCFSATPLAWAEVVEANAGHEDARLAFRDLWESINGADSWHANPWVWAVEFRRVTP